MDQYSRVPSAQPSCILKFDGASKGNPGRSGAGAILQTQDATIHLQEGVGNATSNIAEYRAVNLGMRKALEMGFEDIHVQGDSDLVHKQIQGEWQVRSRNLIDLHNEAQGLKNQFRSFQEQNYAADAEANRAVNLGNGQIEEQYRQVRHSEWK